MHEYGSFGIPGRHNEFTILPCITQALICNFLRKSVDFSVHMEKNGNLFTARDHVQILLRDGTGDNGGENVDDHRSEDGDRHGQQRRQAAVGRQVAHGQTVEAPGGRAHQSAREHRAGKDAQHARAAVQRTTQEDEIHQSHDDIAHQRADRRAVDVDGALGDQEPVDDDLDQTAGDER